MPFKLGQCQNWFAVGLEVDLTCYQILTRTQNLHNVFILEGVDWRDKLAGLRAQFPKLGIDALVITALDEVAWLLNIRGSDIPYEPMLFGYILVSTDDIVLFVDTEKITPEIHAHLNSANCISANCVRLKLAYRSIIYM